jgi:hypothetical protein
VCYADLTSVSSVSVSPATPSIAKGGTQQFTAVVSGTNNPPHDVTWAVEGSVWGSTINTGGLLTVDAGESASSLTVRATSTFDISKSGTATVTFPVLPGQGSVTLVYPTDKASAELSGGAIIISQPGGTEILYVSDTFDTYRWLVDGSIKGSGNSFTLYADNYTTGVHQITLEVTLNGAVYSKSGSFTVQ